MKKLRNGEKVIRKVNLIGKVSDYPLDDSERVHCVRHGLALHSDVFKLCEKGKLASCYVVCNGTLYQCFHDDSHE